MAFILCLDRGLQTTAVYKNKSPASRICLWQPMWQPTGQPNAKPEAINAFMLPAGASSEIIKFKPYPFSYLFLLQPKFDDSGMKKYFISITIFFEYGDNNFYRPNHFTTEWSPLLPFLPNRALVILLIVKLKRVERIVGDCFWAGSVDYRVPRGLKSAGPFQCSELSCLSVLGVGPDRQPVVVRLFLSLWTDLDGQK